MSDTPKPKYRLSDLDLSMVSLVPAGDDPLAKTVLFKAAPDHKTEDEGHDGSTLSHNTSKERSHMADEQDTISKDDLPEEVVEYIEALEKALDDQIAKDEDSDDEDGDDLDAELDLDEDEDDESDDDVEKVLAKADPRLAAIVKSATDRAERAEAIAKAERDERVRRDFVEKAKTLPNIGSPEEVGAILKSIHDLDPKLSAKVEKTYAALNGQLDSAAIFKELGAPGARSSVSESVDAAAEAVRKADPSLTWEQAVAKAYEDNPSLYDEHENA